MKISHEVPLCLLEKSKNFNDYSFCLYHLLKFPKYKEFFIKANEVILDCSTFEFSISEEEFNFDNFYDAIIELYPTTFIVPDVLNDGRESKVRFDKWMKEYQPKLKLPNIKTMAVAQGSNLKEWLGNYHYIRKHSEVDIIGVSFGYNFLKELGVTHETENKSYWYAKGRQELIGILVDDNLISKPLHLLGCYHPNEFKYYQDLKWDFIISIDTSIPVKFGIQRKEIKFDIDQAKPNIILDDFLEKPLNQEQEDIILNNITQFRRYIYGI